MTHVKLIAHSDQILSEFWRTCRSREFARRTDEAGAQVVILNMLEALTPQEAAENTTYLEKMAENLEVLEHALKCA